MSELTSRQQLILGLVIREYVASETENEDGTRRVQPVGSKGLVERYNLDISPATIRSELAKLEDQGYLMHRHTSAGRIPTDSGYRYFVETLMGDVDLSAEEQRTIVHQFHQARLDLDQWMKLAASVLARTSGSVSIVTPPRAQEARFKHLQLISTQGRLVLLILVFMDGAVKQEMLTLADPLSQGDLDAVSTKLNATFNNRTAADIKARRSELSTLEADVVARVTEIMSRADQWAAADVYRDGLSDVLRKPEFEDRESAEGLLKVFEERSLLEDVLGTALNPAVSGVQVVIGSEGRWAELHDCSLVLSRYGVPDRATGALGVVGPTRMSYARTISAVRYVSVLMTNLISDIFEP
jgi:heat-inducible transcriptional repressor